MHTGAGRNRSGRFTTPYSGCVEQSCLVRAGTLRRHHGLWVGLRFCTRVQVSAARDALRYHAVGVWYWAGLSDDRVAVLKDRCGVYGFQDRPGSGSPEAQCINGYIRGTGRHCEEAGGDRQGSLR